jgi:hypothetical protein
MMMEFLLPSDHDEFSFVVSRRNPAAVVSAYPIWLRLSEAKVVDPSGFARVLSSDNPHSCSGLEPEFIQTDEKIGDYVSPDVGSWLSHSQLSGEDGQLSFAQNC